MVIYKNIKIFTIDDNNTYYEDGYIKVTGDKITSIGNMKDLLKEEMEACNIIDGKGNIVIPGMITTHAHFYGQFVRGMSVKQPMMNWQQILSRMWWKVDEALTEEQNYYSTLMGLIEGLKSGTTCYFDHHASPNSTIGSLDLVEKAIRETGARACLAYEVTNRNGHEHTRLGIEENVRFLKKVKDRNDNQIKGLFGLHASYTLDSDTLKECAEITKELNAGFHIHVAEDKADVADSYKIYDKHVVERLYDTGIFGDKTIAAHCVNMGPEQWKLLKETDTTVAHNVQSNTNNAVGICPVVKMMKDGVAVTLGGDGYTYDLFHELSFAIIQQRLREQDPTVFTATQILEFTYRNSSKLSQRIFGEDLGVLKEGALADFIILNYNPPTSLNENNMISHMTSGFSGHVNTVVVGGKEVVKDGRCTFVDEEKIFAECRVQADKLWKSL